VLLGCGGGGGAGAAGGGRLNLGHHVGVWVGG
jgi:hypothetical protein